MLLVDRWLLFVNATRFRLLFNNCRSLTCLNLLLHHLIGRFNFLSILFCLTFSLLLLLNYIHAAFVLVLIVNSLIHDI